MAYEVFTAPNYTEEDPNSRITVTTNKVDTVNLSRDEDAYVYKDKGVDHFAGDFEHLIEFYINSDSTNGCVGYCWVLANAIDDNRGLEVADESMFYVMGYRPNSNGVIYLREYDAGVPYLDSYTCSFNTPYYLKVKRDEAVGDHGTLYCYIYDDAERTSLVDTLTVILHTNKKDFRYIYVAQSYDSNDATKYFTAYAQNLDLQEVGEFVRDNDGDYGPDEENFQSSISRSSFSLSSWSKSSYYGKGFEDPRE